MAIGFLLLFVYVIFLFFIIEKIYKGDAFYLLLYILFFIPFYSVFQLIIFKTTQNIFLIDLIKYSKDFIIFSSFIIFVFGFEKSLIKRRFKTTLLDKLVILFIVISVIYTFIPLGEINLLGKLIYLKNILAIGIVYFFGRNYFVSKRKFNFLKKSLIVIFSLAFLVSSLEYLFGVHLHSILDYANYNIFINDLFPQGNFGLSWTFERSADHPRFASVFPNPLEYSANLLLFLTIPLFHLIHDSKNKVSYFILLLMVLISFYYAFSRASIVSAFFMIVLALFLNKNYKILINTTLILLLSFTIFYLSASDESFYFIIDTLSFSDTSSFSHLLEWIQASITIIDNPLGIGLAMSGNASSVDQAIKIGGENQFLIYGVQMGIITMIIFILIMYKAIKDSISLYKLSDGYEKELSFISGLTKFGLLIPLITANAELYLFVSLFSWFLVGQSQKLLLNYSKQ